jgi:hypothetical protein
VNRLCKLILGSCLCCLLAMATHAQEAQSQAGIHHHPSQDQQLHEKFYSTWHMPDNPSVSCCNDADCYPTEIQCIDGGIYAKRREDGKYIPISAGKGRAEQGQSGWKCPAAQRLPFVRYGVLLRARRRYMRFILVNGRSPLPRSACVMCERPVGANYLHEIGTLLVYCDHGCYADHCRSAVQLLENQAPRSRPNVAKLLDSVTTLRSVRRARVKDGITDEIR